MSNTALPQVPKPIRRVPTLAELIQQSSAPDAVPREAIPSMLADLERIKAELWIHLTMPAADSGKTSDGSDGLLTAKQASPVLGLSVDYLYRHASTLPFTVRLGRKVLFSRAGIDRYIRQRMGQ